MQLVISVDYPPYQRHPLLLIHLRCNLHYV